MTAGRPAEAREVAGLVALARRLGASWKEIARALGWRVSVKTLARMAAARDRGKDGSGRILSTRGAWEGGGEELASGGTFAAEAARSAEVQDMPGLAASAENGNLHR